MTLFVWDAAATEHQEAQTAAMGFSVAGVWKRLSMMVG